MTTFYMIRHAHGVWQPDEMHPLSDRGRSDARRLAALLAPYPLTRIVSSPYPRAVQTVEPLAARVSLPIEIEPDLRERCLTADPQPLPDFEGAVRWTWDNPDAMLEGGEPNTIAQDRGVAIVRRLATTAPDGHIVISTHGSLMALILNVFESSFGFEAWAALTMPDVYRLELAESGGSQLVRLWCP